MDIIHLRESKSLQIVVEHFICMKGNFDISYQSGKKLVVL